MARSLEDILLPEEGDERVGKRGEITPGEVLINFKRAYEADTALHEEMRQDFEFALGKQWEDKDVADLKSISVRALTINKIATHIELLRGLESQNRQQPHAFAEGEEDTAEAEIATRLMKAAVKHSDLDYKISEMFTAGNQAGRSWLEPWLHYPYRADARGVVDITAELKWRHSFYNAIYPDPTSREYDLSDGRYLCKFTSDLSKEQLLEMFPDAADDIESIDEGGKINIDQISLDRDETGTSIQSKEYDENSDRPVWVPKAGYDLLDYYYRRWVPKYYVADFSGKQASIRLVKSKRAAKNFVKAVTARDKNPNRPTAKMIERLQPEIWVAFLTGGLDKFLAHGPAWSFPEWASWPVFGYSAYFSAAPVSEADRHLRVQGITRRVKDNQRELNKRRTQELRHLNQSLNSGILAEDDSLVDEETWRSLGATPGVILKYRKGSQRPEKIIPTPLSTAHAQMAQEHTADMRDSLGVNAETLAIQADQQSGRAIAQRIKQGMVMIQGLFDNLARTRREVYRFILAVLPHLFTIEKAARVLGPAFLQKTFQRPTVDPQTGQPMVDPRTGQPVMEFDQEQAIATINKVLNDAEIGIYDVAVGENIANETIQLGNYMELMEMAKAGMPIPPDVIVEESTLPDAQKKRIIAAFAKAQEQAAAPAAPAPPKRAKRK